MMEKPEALIKVEVLAHEHPHMVTIKETWDPRLPGCPFIIFDKTVFPWKVITDQADLITHKYERHRDIDIDRVSGEIEVE